jgi:hypothetical protein
MSASGPSSEVIGRRFDVCPTPNPDIDEYLCVHITGDEDDAWIQPSLFLKQTVPASSPAIFAKTGHILNLEPAPFNETLARFLVLAGAGRRAILAPNGCESGAAARSERGTLRCNGRFAMAPSGARRTSSRVTVLEEQQSDPGSLLLSHSATPAHSALLSRPFRPLPCARGRI